MGSAASSPTPTSSVPDTSSAIASTKQDGNTESTDIDDKSKTNGEVKSRKKNPPSHLSGAALVEYKCRKKKKAWSECVGTFYGRFSSGKVLEDEQSDCEELFELYRQCYLRGMLKERQKRGLEPPREGTLLAEFMEEEGLDSDTKQ